MNTQQLAREALLAFNVSLITGWEIKADYWNGKVGERKTWSRFRGNLEKGLRGLFQYSFGDLFEVQCNEFLYVRTSRR